MGADILENRRTVARPPLMNNTPRFRHLCLFLAAMSLPLAATAQLAAGKDKFLGNIVANTVPANYNTYWNQITPENAGKWGPAEGTRDSMNWTALDGAYNHAKANGYKFKLHTLVWGSQYPAWITPLSATELREEIEEWMTALAARYPDVWAIDVVNEPTKTPMPDNYKTALGGNGTTGWDWVITSFQLARQKFPNAKLHINEYGTENDANARNQMLVIINLLKDRGLIDGIGIQAHAFNLDHMNAAQMKTALDAYAATGLDLFVTELDIRGIGTTYTEANQSAKYQELFPTIWTHPAIKGVTLWGYIEGQTWMANSGILNANGTERAAMTWLKSYMASIAPSTPASPNGLVATATATQINLYWIDHASTEMIYKVERATNTNGPWIEIANGLAANTTTYAATGLSPATTYYFRVRASNAYGDSDYSNLASATTSATSSRGFNADNQSDILWTNILTGDRAVWLMGTTGSIGGNLLGTIPVDWMISASNDFNGDGNADILWSNTTTGDRAMWLMNGTNMATNAFLSTVPVEWSISGCGDFNGDNRADIFWTNTTTGDRAIWLMDGGTVLGGGYLTTVSLEWHVNGLGDHNGDGKADVLWTNTTTGDRAMWLMNGISIADGAIIGTVSVAWQISASGDYDGDGKADILWTNTTTGDRAMWLMDGTNIATNAFLSTVTVEWIISSSGDYNGDGQADIFWTNTANGDRAMWLMDGSNVIGGEYLGTVPVEWEITN